MRSSLPSVPAYPVACCFINCVEQSRSRAKFAALDAADCGSAAAGGPRKRVQADA